MKVSPLMAAYAARRVRGGSIEPIFVHTGQHYDAELSECFLRDLALPAPDFSLGVGSGSHAEQTARAMVEFEKVCFTTKPDLVVVVGDVNSTLACALVAAKLQIPVAHVEAGLRSFDWSMPEEINRVLTDCLAAYCFTPSEDANENLRREGTPPERIYLVGNIMVDSLLTWLPEARARQIPKWLGLKPVTTYALATLHRPSNTDHPGTIRGILQALLELGEYLPVVFPVHPRTRKQLTAFGLGDSVRFVSLQDGAGDWQPGRIIGTEPMSYLDFISLL